MDINKDDLVKLFERRTGYKPNLQNPTTFCEKSLVKKLGPRDSRLLTYGDKLQVKNIVREKGCRVSPIPTLAINPDSIHRYPVMAKLNGFSGRNKIIKNERDWKSACKMFRRCKGATYGKDKGEWHYKYMEPHVIIEPLFEDFDELKFFCFDGKVKYVYYMDDRYRSFYTPKGEYIDVKQKVNGRYYESKDQSLPDIDLDLMIRQAEKLSEGFDHVRVDLMSVNGELYLTEYTFFHFSGMLEFIPKEFDYELGTYWEI